MNIKTNEGKMIASDLKFAIVVGRFNDFIGSKLLSGAIDALIRHGAAQEDIEVTYVPGAFEIPFATQKMAKSKKFDAIICLGAVIRGSTPHFDYVCAETSKGIAKISLDSDIPVIFGILTTETIEQAIERAGTKAGNKGYEAATTAIEMSNLSKIL